MAKRRIVIIILTFSVVLTFMVMTMTESRWNKVHNEVESPEPQALSLSVGWTTKKARESSVLLRDLPPSFDEWQLAIFYEPIRFTYDNGTTDFTIEKTHRVSILPKNGKIEGISITINPLFQQDQEAAFKTVSDWNNYFESHGLKAVKNSKWSVDSIDRARSRFKESPSKRFGMRMGLWTEGVDFYHIGIERFESGDTQQSIQNTNADTITMWTYSVSVNIWD